MALRPLPAKRLDELREIALAADLPSGVTDVGVTTVGEPGERLPNGDPSGLGGSVKFAPVWIIEGRRQSEPIALVDTTQEATALYTFLVGEEGELWRRKQRRLEAIEALEAEERAAVKEGLAHSTPHSSESNAREKNSRPRSASSSATPTSGGGSPRPSPSSERPSTLTPVATMATPRLSQRRSSGTPSPR